MSMNAMYDLRDMLCKELEEISRKGEMSAGDLDAVHKLTDTIKNIDKIERLEDSGYSRGGDWEADMRGTYGRGSSYANRGRHYVRGHYSRADAAEHMRRQLNELMRGAEDDRTRDALRRCIDTLEG